MLTRILEYHSGRAIALCRLALAVVFVVALYVDPNQPVRDGATAFALIGSYVAVALALVLVTWNSWWLDHILRLPALLCDAAMFLTAFYFTESGVGDLTSPFLSFFIFIMLSATLRWGWRGMAIVAAGLTASYIAAGLALEISGFDIEFQRFGRRGIYMMLLSVILVWFGLQRRTPAVRRLDFTNAEAGDVPIVELAEYAQQATGSRFAIAAWWSDEEPNVLACATAGEAPVVVHLPPDVLPEPERQVFALFDGPRTRMLVSEPDGRLVAIRKVYASALADQFGIEEGLAIPLASSSGKGLVILDGDRGLSTDYLTLAPALAQEMAAALDRHLLTRISREAAVAHLRATLARDLHDSVAQTIAGVRYRLEGIRAQVRAGTDPGSEFDELKASLSSEHRNLREMIERLRRTELEPRKVKLAGQLKGVASELERTWKAKLNLSIRPEDLTVPVELAYEVQQIAREAVANGVRHGEAKTFSIAVSQLAAGIDLDIRDDGTGFTGEPPIHPRTLAERARANGGTLTVCNSRSGAHLLITLPNRN